MRIVMKFGGTSVGDGERIRNVAGLVAAQALRGDAVVVAVSAMSGVTDTLIRSARRAADGDAQSFLSAERELMDKHLAALDTAVSDPAAHAAPR